MFHGTKEEIGDQVIFSGVSLAKKNDAVTSVKAFKGEKLQEICDFLHQTTDVILGGALGVNPWQFEVLTCSATATLNIIRRKIKFFSSFSSFPLF